MRLYADNIRVGFCVHRTFSDHWSLTEVISDVHVDYDGAIISRFRNGGADVRHTSDNPPPKTKHRHPFNWKDIKILGGIYVLLCYIFKEENIIFHGI